MMNTIYLRRANKLIVNEGQGPGRLSKAYLATAINNIEHLGFALSYPLLHAVRTLPEEQFEAFYQPLIDDLRVLVGAHVKYEPMYPAFPMQVMDEEDAELYLNAIYHYLTWDMPEYELEERPPLHEEVKLKVIELGSKADFYAMIRQLIQAKGSISQTDKEDIETVIELADPDELDAILPLEIPFKENAGFVAAALMKHDKGNVELIGRYFTTATDVLRLAAAWSGGESVWRKPRGFANLSGVKDGCCSDCWNAAIR